MNSFKKNKNISSSSVNERKYEFLKSEKEIRAWLDKHDVKDYEIEKDLKVSVSTSVYLNHLGLDFIPVKFNQIKGDFKCCDNQLTTLDFAPVLVNGTFECSNNPIKSLENCPQTITEDFVFTRTLVDNLEFFPKHIGGNVFATENVVKKLAPPRKKFVFGNASEPYQRAHKEALIEKEKYALQNAISPMAPEIDSTIIFKI